MNPSEKKKPETRGTKKKYTTPVMHSYGAVRSLTKNVGMTGVIDGGGKNPRTGLP